METKMIKIERNAKMETAIARCKANHPKVRRVDAQTVTVYGSKGAAYTVKLAEPRPGLKLAACDCPAGRESKLCYHIPAALVAPAIRTGVAAQKPADERAEAKNFKESCANWDLLVATLQDIGRRALATKECHTNDGPDNRAAAGSDDPPASPQRAARRRTTQVRAAAERIGER